MEYIKANRTPSEEAALRQQLKQQSRNTRQQESAHVERGDGTKKQITTRKI
ncbi:hypothetical protein [Staphylococcus pettenkoferi]|uniref:Uncharacterized protein n=1 Tax=Staphylococcus pettenkoferi TaxID=170573 RepID=A0A9Q4GZ23_9STAP|nr:hypothetical protein [Staphylococcus pettenkoferi]MCY1569959.1 hypothetical protein [Staphylococcus pettenkoferi]MCY1576269.1 hypothetical protein [Staphylococcus pettenkoferi]MCY1594055.1 hypothetical protein [Staphylococcus pettenkoferi]MCY1616845.1 hypothetical protein [Staphylococcus pettenkoferi]